MKKKTKGDVVFMKHAKQLLCLALCCLFLTCALLPAFAAEEPTIKGKCGSYAGYTLNTDTGELHVYIIGGAKSAYMDNFKNHTSPFYGNPAIKTVVIEAWIWNIGSEAFAGCANLEQVTLAFTVNRIGANAFAGCDKARFTYEGTENAWNDVEIDEGNDWKNDPSRITFTTVPLEYVSAELPLPNEGDKVQLNQVLKVGDSTKYSAELIQVSFLENENTVYLKNGDILQADTAYQFDIAFYPADGYAIEDETTFEVNGTPQSPRFGTVSLTVVPQPSCGKASDNRQNEPDGAQQENTVGGPFSFLAKWFRQIVDFFRQFFKR